MSDSSIEARWSHLRHKRRTALIPYLTAGFPTAEVSRAALEMVVDAGADFVEVGVPFSDPVADGPVIQRANQIALEGGMNLAKVLAMVREVDLEIPIILFGYVNPILAYGLERFVTDASEAGVAGVLLTDVPGGEDAAVEGALADSPLTQIQLIAPTTNDARCGAILRNARGFVYVIARLGVTGARTEVTGGLEATVARVRRCTSLPIVVGFGLTEGRQLAAAAAIADGVVVGSALVQRLEQGLANAREFFSGLRMSLDNAAPIGEGVA